MSGSSMGRAGTGLETIRATCLEGGLEGDFVDARVPYDALLVLILLLTRYEK